MNKMYVLLHSTSVVHEWGEEIKEAESSYQAADGGKRTALPFSEE